MENSKSHRNIFSTSPHFTDDELIRYSHHIVSEEKRHEMEMHLVDCELCSEALKGLAEMKNVMLLSTISKELHHRARRKNLWKKNIFSQNELIAIFAVVFLILFLVVISIFFFSKQAAKTKLRVKKIKWN